jgi:hypothetical protein
LKIFICLGSRYRDEIKYEAKLTFFVVKLPVSKLALRNTLITCAFIVRTQPKKQQSRELDMRILALSSALIIAAAALFPVTAESATRKHGAKSMSVRLANGRTVRMRLVRMNGRMMAIVPMDFLSKIEQR